MIVSKIFLSYIYPSYKEKKKVPELKQISYRFLGVDKNTSKFYIILNYSSVPVWLTQ